jgi:hypothetical protein
MTRKIMGSIGTTLVALGCMVCGVQLGNFLRRASPEHHRSGDSRDAIRSGAAVIGTLAALVLGLMVSSASKNFDAVNGGLTENAASYIDLDRILAQYGTDSQSTRNLLRQGVEAEIDRLWPAEGDDVPSMVYSPELEAVAGSIRDLKPQSESQQILKPRALQVLGDALKQRWLVVAHGHSYVPTVFVVIVVFWFTVLFAVFALLSPSNVTANSFMTFCTIAVAGGVFLVLDMSLPFEGLIRVNPAPMETVLKLLGR